MKIYDNNDLISIENRTKKNKKYIKIMCLICFFFLVSSLFFVDRYIQWYNHSTVRNDAFFNDGKIDYNPFTASRTRKVEGYDKDTYEYIGEVTIIIDY